MDNSRKKNIHPHRTIHVKAEEAVPQPDGDNSGSSRKTKPEAERDATFPVTKVTQDKRTTENKGGETKKRKDFHPSEKRERDRGTRPEVGYATSGPETVQYDYTTNYFPSVGLVK
ncbi:hypothetical protein RUM44_006435 [Polyplax serrata]|uniref:Uncharacterized protein n=1 Tax=Polyplax serrata TaxID=468196 RepID=A0ABR1AIT7_POLSC